MQIYYNFMILLLPILTMDYRLLGSPNNVNIEKVYYLYKLIYVMQVFQTIYYNIASMYIEMDSLE